MTREAWDAIVVGGGPAGSATAARLARAGHAVLVLDRAEFPRRKPCGECVNPAGVAALERLGVLDAVRDAGAVPIAGWRIDAGCGAGFGGSYPPETPGLALPRERLDAVLLDHARDAGAEVRTGVRVVDLLRDDAGAVVGVRTDATSSDAASTDAMRDETTPSSDPSPARGGGETRRGGGGGDAAADAESLRPRDDCRSLPGDSFPRRADGISMPTTDRRVSSDSASSGGPLPRPLPQSWGRGDASSAGGRSRSMGDAGSDGDELPARVVVGADGLRSVVVRRLGLVRRTPRLLKLALTAHLRGVDGVDGGGELRVLEGGCVGVARVGNDLWNVTVVVAGDGRTEVGGDAEGFFDRTVRRAGIVGTRADAVLATGPFDWPVRRAAGAGVLLVGDAAGYYDPFTGQGIFRALLGAESAAATADAALRAGDVSAGSLAEHDRTLRRAFASGRRLQHVVEAFVSRPPLLRAASRRLARRRAFADALIRATGDVAPVRSLLDPRLFASSG